MYKVLVRKNDNVVLAEKSFFARSFFHRFRGMIGRKFAAAGFDAMVFEKCSAIHCCWMSEAIDVMFVTENLEVTKLCHNVKPWHFANGGSRTAHTVELPAGKLAQCEMKVGDVLEFKPLQCN